MGLSSETLLCFRESLDRCQADPQFLGQFYNKFVVASPLVREKFANTDMESQKMMLHASLYMIAMATSGNKAASHYLDTIAKRHGKLDLKIPTELYTLWLEILISTVSLIDPEYNNTIETAWREVMQFGIDYMQSHDIQ